VQSSSFTTETNQPRAIALDIPVLRTLLSRRQRQEPGSQR
jgi:hypothetical protein